MKVKTRFINAIISLSLGITGASLQEASLTVNSPLAGVWYLTAEIHISLDVELLDGPRVEQVRANPMDFEVCTQWDTAAARCSSLLVSNVVHEWPPLNTSSKSFFHFPFISSTHPPIHITSQATFNLIRCITGDP